MNERFVSRSIVLSLMVSLVAASAFAQATQPAKPYEPTVGQEGKDVVWVPTPQVLVEKMLDMAKVTPQDFVIDLGSGDGRTVITAAKRGARAMGIEYNPDMVELSRKNAAAAEGERQGDVREGRSLRDRPVEGASHHDVPAALDQHEAAPRDSRPKPGTRIVTNSFTMEDWQADQSETVTEDCSNWCTAHLWIVPAKVEGTWQLPQGNLTLKQQFQMISGTLGSTTITEGRLRGDQIEFTVGSTKYTGRVDGQTIRGTSADGKPWTATKG